MLQILIFDIIRLRGEKNWYFITKGKEKLF